ncbi:MAG: hypothetical protein ACYDA6_04140 [Solirubrobacteraceae bacterium]
MNQEARTSLLEVSVGRPDLPAADGGRHGSTTRPVEYGRWTASLAKRVWWCALAALFALFSGCSLLAACYAVAVGDLSAGRFLLAVSLTVPTCYLSGRAAIRIPSSGVSIGCDAVTIVSPWLTRRVALEDAEQFIAENKGDLEHAQPMIALRRRGHIDVGVWALNRSGCLASARHAVEALQLLADQLNTTLERAKGAAEASAAMPGATAAPTPRQGVALGFVAALTLLVVGSIASLIVIDPRDGSGHFMWIWHSAAGFFTTVGIGAALVGFLVLALIGRARLRRRHVLIPTGSPSASGSTGAGRSAATAQAASTSALTKDQGFTDPFGRP